MIAVLYGGEAGFDERTYARYWIDQYKRIEADRAFGRIRWTARLRRLGRLLLSRAAGEIIRPTQEAESAAMGSVVRDMISIDSIVGVVDARTGVFGPIPALKRRWKGTWRRLWTVDDLDVLPALPIARGPDGWYLVDPPHSVLVLEVLRAKGVREIRKKPAAAAFGTAASCIEVEDAAKKPTYRLVECERGEDCCDQEAGVAV